MTRDEHISLGELATGHALGALEPGDEQAFLAHLPSCAACERAAAEHLETAAHLAYAADPVPLPDALLGRIRAEVAASGRSTTSVRTAATPIEAARSRRRAGTLPRAWLAVAAAAALVLSLATWNVALRQDQSSTQQRAERLAAAVHMLEGGQRVLLSDGKGRSVAVAVMHGDRVSLVVDGLAPNDRSSSTYVLWQTGATGTRPVGAFDVRGRGVDVVRDLPLVTSLRDWTAFAVTKEPGRTAPSVPGSMPVANGSRV